MNCPFPGMDPCLEALSLIHNTDNSNDEGRLRGMRFAPGLEAGWICQTSMERTDVRRDCRGVAGD